MIKVLQIENSVQQIPRSVLVSTQSDKSVHIKTPNTLDITWMMVRHPGKPGMMHYVTLHECSVTEWFTHGFKRMKVLMVIIVNARHTVHLFILAIYWLIGKTE